MLKEIFKPDSKKLNLWAGITIFAAVLLFLWLFEGWLFEVLHITILWEILKIIGLPLQIISMFGSLDILIIPLFFLTLLYIYILSCLLLYLVNKIKIIKWDAKKYAILFIIVILLFVVYGFSSLGWSDIFVPTADDSGATTEGVNEIVEANNKFAINLYSEICNETSKNIFFSPWSISSAVVMAYEGSGGQTANEIASVFDFPAEDNLRRSSYARMLNTLNKAGGKYQLNTANAIWLQKDYHFLKDYKDTISRYYLGEVNNLDFVNNPGDASSEINNWVSKNTNSKIREIVSPSMFNKESRAVLTNAIYFKGKWVNKFDRDDTKQENFTLTSGEKTKVPMMRLEDDDLDFNYAESDGIQILEMPYRGNNVSMLVLLPRTELTDMAKRKYEMKGKEPQTSNITELEAMLSAEKLDDWRSQLKPETVYIYMPKFTFETSYNLSDYLKKMGMELPFTRGADFSGMDGTQQLYIDNVLHKAYIDVYEEGTEAAAATSMGMGPIGMPEYTEFRADHPFIFLIQEKSTGNILFMGRVNNPS